MFGARSPDWKYELLDSHNVALESLDGVVGGGCSVAAQSRLGWSGNLTIKDTGQELDWMSNRVRVSYDPGVKGVSAWPVATLLFTSPTEKIGIDGVTYDVQLLSALSAIDGDSVDETYSIPAGTPIIPTVVGLIRSTGETHIAVTESDAVTRGQIVHAGGTSKLTIINELLEAAGYWSLWVDGTGTFRVEPYVNPGDREPVYKFEYGAASVYEPDWTREQDLAGVPNKFVVVGQGTDEEPGPVGVALNEDPESPFSVPSRGGRVITARDEGVEVADEAAAHLLAQRRLLDQMSPVARIEASHAVLDFNPNDVVSFAPHVREERRVTVQGMSWTFTPGSLIGAEWREVISV